MGLEEKKKGYDRDLLLCKRASFFFFNDGDDNYDGRAYLRKKNIYCITARYDCTGITTGVWDDGGYIYIFFYL